MIKLFYFFVALMLSQPLFSQTLETDRLALIDLYNATNGPNWTNKTGWNVPGTPGDNPCGWYGVSCSGGRVTSINLNNNNLAGNIPASIEKLSNLQSLYLYFNQLSGNIPSEIGNLSNLQYLNLFSNQLTGSIPSEIGNLSKLLALDLTNNQLTGNIPAEIGNLSQLKGLNLSNNPLTGRIPNQIENLSQLVELRLQNNQLTGSIQDGIGNLKSLRILNLSQNQLAGSIPVEIGKLTSLTNLVLYSNQLTGGLPASIGNLTNLVSLELNNNQLSGNIPASIGNLPNLQILYLYSNQLSGSIPVEIGILSNLQYLSLSSNQLSGSIPATIGNLTKLTFLNLQSNQLTGQFNLSGIPASANVILQGNKFTFDGIESNASLLDFYSSQANIPITNTAGVLSVNAGGTLANNTYQWYRRNPGTLIATNVGNANYTPTISGTYSVQVSNSIATGLTLTSDDITVTITNTPTFSIHPSSVTVCPNTGVTFTVSAANANTYQWQVKIGASDFVNLSEGGVYVNVTSNQLIINNVTGLNGYQYRCVATGTEGSANSNAATLTVGAAIATLTLQSPEDDITIASPTKNALHITATNKIRATGTVIYQAVQSVVLNPGFEAQAGSIFTAQIGSCN